MTIGGTDYYSDVTFNLSLVLGDDFRAKRVATVSKTNVGHLYQLGRKMENLTFGQLVREVNAQAPIKQVEVAVDAGWEADEAEEQAITLDDLLRKAEEYGIAEAHMSKAAARYCKGKSLSQLDTGEIEMLYDRLVASREAESPDAGQDGSSHGGVEVQSDDGPERSRGAGGTTLRGVEQPVRVANGRTRG
jgi:hypothetical protein